MIRTKNDSLACLCLAADKLSNSLLFLDDLFPDLLLLGLNLLQNFCLPQINRLHRLVFAKNFDDFCGLMNLFEQIRGFDVVTLIITLGLWEGSRMLARVE